MSLTHIHYLTIPNCFQGGQIMDNALCGGSGATLTGNALNAVKAAIFMGDPHNRNGLPYNVGTCQAGGVSNYTITFLYHH